MDVHGFVDGSSDGSGSLRQSPASESRDEILEMDVGKRKGNFRTENG